MGAEAEQPSESAALALLLSRVAEGDEAAFRRIYLHQVRRFTGVALRLTRDSGLARDAVHDAFLEIWRSAHRFDHERGTAEAWMLSIIRYRALAIVRQRSREALGVDRLLQLDVTPDATPDVVDRLQDRAGGAALRACLATLDAQSRQLIALAFVEGLSHRELAQHLHIPLGTIKSSLRRCFEALRRCLSR